jgi:hypothetical protein
VGRCPYASRSRVVSPSCALPTPPPDGSRNLWSVDGRESDAGRSRRFFQRALRFHLIGHVCRVSTAQRGQWRSPGSEMPVATGTHEHPQRRLSALSAGFVAQPSSTESAG